MANTTIADELLALVNTKDEIARVLESIAAGATSGYKFSQYGDIIEGLLAIQYVGSKSSHISGSTLNLNNLLLTTKKLACYYVHVNELKNKNITISNIPTGLDAENCFIMSFYMNPADEDANASEKAPRAIQLLLSTSKTKNIGIYLRVKQNTSWDSWKELVTDSKLSSTYLTKTDAGTTYLTKTDASNTYATKSAVEDLNTATTGAGAPTISGTAGQIYVDTTNKNVYIHDSSKWQLMNSWQ